MTNLKEAEESNAESCVDKQVSSEANDVHLEGNPTFSQYYLTQQVLSCDEIEQFCTHLKTALPLTFQVSSQCSTGHAMQQLLLTTSSLQQCRDSVSSMSCLASGEQMWQVNWSLAPKSVNTFLKHQVACGNVLEVNAISCIPVSLMDIKPGQKVLDMAGVETVQLLGRIHFHCAQLDAVSDGLMLAGVPICAAGKSCELVPIGLSVSPQLVLVQLDPANLPYLCTTTDQACGREMMKYDRILCHVPASDDAMLRNNVDSSQCWSPVVSAHHFSRVCRMVHSSTCQLAVGGRLVYCVYSVNPVDNEAVIAAILSQQKGSVELVDVSSELAPTVKYKSGLTHWKVMTKSMQWCDSFTDVVPALRYHLRESMFAPASDVASGYHLERCLRILPHQQDTAGMFIAVLHRTKLLEDVLKTEREAQKAEADRQQVKSAAAADMTEVMRGDDDASSDTAAETGSMQEAHPCSDDKATTCDRKRDSRQCQLDDEASIAQRRRQSFFQFLKSDDAAWREIRSFFGISSEFPVEQLMKCASDETGIYFVSSAVKQLIESNEHTLNIRQAGVKMFFRLSYRQSRCNYCITQEGIEVIRRYLSQQVIHLSPAEFSVVLRTLQVAVESLRTETRLAVSRLGVGNVLLVCQHDASDNVCLTATGWYDGCRLQSFIAEYRRLHYLDVLSGPTHIPARLSDEHAATSERATDVLAAFASAAVALEHG